MIQPFAHPLLKADQVTRLGLTKTQVFFMVGRRVQKALCRFVKTDRLKDAFSTLLSIKGVRRQIKDIRLGETPGSIKLFTDQGEEYIPSAEASAFLSRYNQFATEGCSNECQCEDVWRHFCVHRIAEHLVNVKEKVATVVRAAKDIHPQWKGFHEQLEWLLDIQGAARLQGLSSVGATPDPFAVEIANKDSQLLGQILFSENSWLVKFADQVVSVSSWLEGLIILKDPAQLDVDF